MWPLAPDHAPTTQADTAAEAARATLTPTPGTVAPRRRGWIDFVRAFLTGWPGPREASAQPRVERAVEEGRVSSGPPNLALPWFAPYLDEYTAEPADARACYRRMFADPNVKAAFLGKLTAVAALDLRVSPSGGHRASAADRTAADLVRWNLTERLEGGFPGLVWSVLSGGLIDGHSVCEKVFAPQTRGRWAGTWPLVRLKPKDVGIDLAIRTDRFRNVVDLIGLRYNAGRTFHPGRFLVWRHLPLYDAPTGTSDFRAAYGRWWVMDTLLKLRAVAAEKRSLPFLVGTYQTPSQKPTLDLMLAQVKSQNWASVPEGVRVDVLNIAGSADGVFEAFIRDLKHDIFLSIQGAILQSLEGTTNSGRGSSAVHQSTSYLLIRHLAASLEALLNDQEGGLVRDIVDVNCAVSDCPRVTLQALDPEEQRTRLDVDERLARLVPLSARRLYESYDREPPDPADPADRAGGPPPAMPQPQTAPAGVAPGDPAGDPAAEPPPEELEWVP